MLATGLSASTQSGVGIAAATVSPMISYEIGQKFKELAKDNPDGKLTEKQQAAHVLAHAVLGAAVAAAGGNDALAGALSAGGAEAVAPKVSTFLYGTADPEKLTAEQKDTVANIMSLAGAGVGVAVGNTSTNAVSGSLNAQSSVGNNSQLFDDLRSWTKEKANNAAKSARELFPNTPALSGFFLGLGDVADGGLGLTDATAESLAMAIHCVGGGNYCNTAIKNNQERGRVLLDVAKSIPDGRIKSALEHWGHNLLHGTPEQRREATEQLARASTALGVGSAVGSPKVNPFANLTGKITYGSTDLSKLAINYAKQNNITGGRNVAVFEYIDLKGRTQTLIRASERGKGHAERLIAEELQNKGIPNENVTRIYSELEPCSAPGGYCNNMIKNGSPSGLGPFNNAKVTYSFSYGGSPHNAEAARQGVEKLKRARQKQ